MEDTVKEQDSIHFTANHQGKGADGGERKRRLPWWRLLIRWVAGVLGGVVVLLLLVTALLYVPAIQNWVVDTATRELRNTIGYDVEIGRIRIGFPAKLKLDGVVARELGGEKVVGHFDLLTAQVSPMPLLQGGVVPISGVALKGVELDFPFPNDSLFLQGHLDEVEVNKLRLDTQTSLLELDYFSVKDADVRITIINDTIKKDKPKGEPSPLVILIGKAKIENVASKVAPSLNTLLVDARVNHADIEGVEVNLPHKYYQAKQLKIEAWLGKVGADIDFLPMPWVARIEGDHLRYGGPNDVQGNIHRLYYEVGDGWQVKNGKIKAHKDSLQLLVEDLDLHLAETHLLGGVRMPFNRWAPAKEGVVDIDLRGEVNPSEVERFVGGVGGIPKELYQLSLKGQGEMEGDLDLQLFLSNPQTVTLDLSAKGSQILEKEKGTLTAEYQLLAGAEATRAVAQLASGGGSDEKPFWQIPNGMSLTGKAEMRGDQLGTNFSLSAPQGKLQGYLQYQPKLAGYKAQLQIQELGVQHFLPKDSLGVVNGILQLDGHGTDPFNKLTHAHLFLNIDSLQYAGTTFNQMTLLSELREGYLFGALDSEDEALSLTAQVDASLSKEEVFGSINLFVDTVIPNQIGVDLPIVQGAKLELRGTLRSDLKECHDFEGELENFWIHTDKNLINPTNTYVVASTSEEKMYAEVTSGDLSLKVNVDNGLKDFSSRVNHLSGVITESLADSLGQLNMAPWLAYYPTMDVKLSMGRNNLLRAYLDEHRIGARSASLNLHTTTSEGLTGDGVVSFFQMDTFRIDNIDLVLRQDSAFFYAFSSVHKEPFRNQLPFTIVSSLTTNVGRSEVYLRWIDHRQEDFLQLGLELWNKKNGDLTFGFTPDPIVLFHNTFDVVGEDYVTLPKADRKKLLAHLELHSPTGANISLYSQPTEQGHLLQANLQRLRLARLSGMSFLPDLQGTINASATWLQPTEGEREEYHLGVDVADFKYEQKPIGTLQIGADAQLEPKHGTLLTANATIEQQNVAQLIAYQPATPTPTPRRIWLRAQALPLVKANPFIPTKYAQLSGVVNGEIANYDTHRDITQATILPYYGTLRLTNAEVFVPMVNETFQLDDHPIKIRDGQVLLDNFQLTSNNSSLSANGYMELNKAGYPLNLSFTANDFLLLSSTPTDDTELYGTARIDADVALQGPLKGFQLLGDIAIKGSTNLTYKTRESELQQRNNFKGLVEFTDFSDTLFVAKRTTVDSLSLSGHDVRLALHIDPATRVTAYFSPDEQNRASIQGGGDFNLSIPPYGTMNLSGTYDVQEGDVALSLSMPPISRKFTINPASRVIWNGALLDPHIDVSATSKIRSQVSQTGQPSRSVDFDVTLFVENNLENLALRFETKAPSDLAIQNSLATLSPEEQNRQSLMLLSTGMYFGAGTGQSSKGFDMNSTLTSLVASQFNALAGEALDAEINLGVSNTSNAYGQGTDYTYSIAKRFYNDRISVVMGGRMMTGQAAANMQQTFIDNMSLEYRLDEAGTHYLRLFHRRNLENLLDGEVIETGVGYLNRRRLNRLQDLFNFRKEQPSKAKTQPNEPKDNEPQSPQEATPPHAE